MLLDLHVHSTFSPCSSIGLQDILSQAQSKGLDGVCITDHDTMAARQWISEGIQANGLCIIVGQEYSTRQGDFLLFGDYAELRPGLSAFQVLSHVQATGGVAVAAHPFRSHRQVDQAIVQAGLCSVIEQDNGRNTRLENSKTQAWLKHYPLIPVAGSDAHTLLELGRCPIQFHFPIFNSLDLIQALKSGQGFSMPDRQSEQNLDPAC